MRDERRNYAVVGVFVIAMLAGLLVWIAVLTGRTGATDPYYILYDNVLGLGAGTQVYFEGYSVGRIEDIAPVRADGRQRFRVDVSVRRGWRIPEDSVAEITASGLLSAVIVDIRAGSSERFLEPGSTIRSIEAGNLFATLSSVAGELGDLAEKSLRPLLDSLAEGAPNIVSNLEDFTGVLQRSSDRIDRILRSVESVASNFDSVSAELVGTQAQLDGALRSLNAFLEENEGDVSHAIGDLHDSLESVARHVDAITHNLEATSRNMNEFSRQIRRNPGVLIRGRSLGDAGAEASP